MEDLRQNRQAKKLVGPNDLKGELSTRKPKLPSVLTPENIEKAYTAVKNKGEIGACNSVLNANPSTILKWRKKFPEFGQRISQALEDHNILMSSKHPEYFILAMSSIETQLQDRVMEDVTITEEQIIDEKTNEIIATKRKKKVRRYTREPNWKAIEKVLGKNELRNIVYGTLKDSKEIKNINIVNQLFGKWIRSDELGAQWNGSILDDQLDLMMMRTLQAETRRLYEGGKLSFKEYNRDTIEQTKNYGYLANNREKRAIKLLKGKSYSSILIMMQAQVQDILNIVEEVCNDINIKRREIPNEIFKKVRKLSRIRGFSAWSESQTSKSTKK